MSDKQVLVNGEPQEPIRKFKLPRDKDWQAVVRDKRGAKQDE